ncbi:DNA mismatch repair endonuclease MutL [Shewanella eurypsychrophilus]|uniref:DNA mismatch repair protein MutL n=1 Tax=Shewanella eurypsychrophilus TaxID=2593656 RepID=A0ABX6VAS1_9GAMM|nr:MULTISPECIES: DNA mismatch repair endonuclease MutL [Shewanella]QFU24428.1 DNA mismatch repair endonuclease MutL [Shewanella sp. YLB-09]QPG59628.1 DNA mismatch repair endonuclease MutL [Shewanella eurypsychrophilus]
MTIQILPPQLANQIAAGEVVERPASVIKELVENSLDAGATRVDIEIEKGGSKLIKIHDNGSGIPKDELALALSRHATSKLSTLDDLDAILSFGFRGEALASISSVSRLTLTSRTEEQSEAWQAYAEGSDMAVKVIPAAHPVGSTVEAVDLFFNTPARRRFLKSDKTEFTHIDEWLKRIALVRSEIHFTLKNNGKTVRNYRPAKTSDQYLQRLAQISGKKFAQQAIEINCEHDDLKLSGYIQSPYFESPASDTQYFYVNGRLVRDRLVNHAVRQAFAEHVTGAQASYVLMLDLDPHQVDVNVHPAKHEVRFHQSRYIHDYILQVLQSALAQVGQALPAQETHFSEIAPDALNAPELSIHDAKYQQASHSKAGAVNEPVKAMEQARTTASGPSITPQLSRNMNASYVSGDRLSNTRSSSRPQTELPSSESIAAYGALLTTPNVPNTVNELAIEGGLPAAPAVLANQYWVLAKGEELSLLSIEKVADKLLQVNIASKLDLGLISQPLLMPVSIAMDEDWIETIEQREVLLRKIGIELTIRLGQLIIKKVPPYLRQSRLVTVVPELLQWFRFEEPSQDALASWLVSQVKQDLSVPESIWLELLQSEESVQQELMMLTTALPWQSWLEAQLNTQ